MRSLELPFRLYFRVQWYGLLSITYREYIPLRFFQVGAYTNLTVVSRPLRL